MSDPKTHLDEARQAFLALVAEVRPDLHRYCARMTGSIADGEDIVQETLARAFYALPEQETMPALRPWLFRIAHNCAVNHLLRYERRMGEPLDEARGGHMVDGRLDPEESLAREQAVRAALSSFAALAPAQRSAVILKDVLGHSLEDIAAMIGLTLPAVKAALHRGRERLREVASAPAAGAAPGAVSPVVARYAALFNARDWDGVRAMLVDDVQLDVVSRLKRAGRWVHNYFANYDRLRDWYMVPGWLDGREVVAAYRDADAPRPAYFIVLDTVDGRVAAIRDFRYVPYIAQDAAFTAAIS